MVGFTITTDESATADVSMNAFHVEQSEIPKKSNLSNFQQFETKFADVYDSDG